MFNHLFGRYSYLHLGPPPIHYIISLVTQETDFENRILRFRFYISEEFMGYLLIWENRHFKPSTEWHEMKSKWKTR